METRSYIRVYRKTQPFTSNIVVFPDGSVYEMNDMPTHPTFGVCLFFDTVDQIHCDTRKWGKLYRDLQKLPKGLRENIESMIKERPSFMEKPKLAGVRNG